MDYGRFKMNKVFIKVFASYFEASIFHINALSNSIVCHFCFYYYYCRKSQRELEQIIYPEHMADA